MPEKPVARGLVREKSGHRMEVPKKNESEGVLINKTARDQVGGYVASSLVEASARRTAL